MIIFNIVDINECKNNICKNGGECKNSQGGYTCTCSDRFEGKNCEKGQISCILFMLYINMDIVNISLLYDHYITNNILQYFLSRLLDKQTSMNVRRRFVRMELLARTQLEDLNVFAQLDTQDSTVNTVSQINNHFIWFNIENILFSHIILLQRIYHRIS